MNAAAIVTRRVDDLSRQELALEVTGRSDLTQKCYRCGHYVILAPSSLALIAVRTESGEETVALCVTCLTGVDAAQVMAMGGPEMVPGAVDELEGTGVSMDEAHKNVAERLKHMAAGAAYENN